MFPRSESECLLRYSSSWVADCSKAFSVLAESKINWWGFWLLIFWYSGVSSKTMCALVPPSPKELIPALRGFLPFFQSLNWSFTKKGVFAKSIWGLGVLKCRFFGSFACFKAKTVLMIPATQAPASRCPILVLTEPMAQNPFWPVKALKALVSPAISTGSPIAVPVPCASI